MALSAGIEDRIQKLFDEKYKEYAAHDRALSALAAFRFVLEFIPEINQETVFRSFRPRVCSRGSESNPRTPDGLIVQRPSHSSVLELKTSWNKGDVTQVTNYGKAEGYLQDDGTLTRFSENHCILLGYQNVPGDLNLEALFDEWEKQKPPASLVAFRHSFESAPTGDRMFFSRIPFGRNGACPRSNFGTWINSARGFSVSAASFSRGGSEFHKSNDQVIDSYAAVIWWTAYAKHYLSEEQLADWAWKNRSRRRTVSASPRTIAFSSSFPGMNMRSKRAKCRSNSAGSSPSHVTLAATVRRAKRPCFKAFSRAAALPSGLRRAAMAFTRLARLARRRFSVGRLPCLEAARAFSRFARRRDSSRAVKGLPGLRPIRRLCFSGELCGLGKGASMGTSSRTTWPARERPVRADGRLYYLADVVRPGDSGKQ